MKFRIIALLILLLCPLFVFSETNISDIVSSIAEDEEKQLEILHDYYKEELGDARKDLKLAKKVAKLQTGMLETDQEADTSYVLRSKHYVFGAPRLKDDRYKTVSGPGVSLLVREGFAVAYVDELNSPIWVSQLWAKHNLIDEMQTPSLERDFIDDPAIPVKFHLGTDFKGNTTFLDLGHLAMHSMNRAWGFDSSITGCLMSNVTPQHREINRFNGAWLRLEKDVTNIVTGVSHEIDSVWTISGAVFQDANMTSGEAPDADLKKVATITDGFSVPYATYKIVAWFDKDKKFQARGYIFEQPYTKDGDGKPVFTIPDQKQPLETFIVPIKDIEERTGVNFFPLLIDADEKELEEQKATDMWGEAIDSE